MFIKNYGKYLNFQVLNFIRRNTSGVISDTTLIPMTTLPNYPRISNDNSTKLSKNFRICYNSISVNADDELYVYTRALYPGYLSEIKTCSVSLTPV